MRFVQLPTWGGGLEGSRAYAAEKSSALSKDGAFRWRVVLPAEKSGTPGCPELMEISPPPLDSCDASFGLQRHWR